MTAAFLLLPLILGAGALAAFASSDFFDDQSSTGDDIDTEIDTAGSGGGSPDPSDADILRTILEMPEDDDRTEFADVESNTDSVIGTDGIDVINLGNGADTALSGDGSDTILGLAGPDSIDGGAGNDAIHGGGGYDTLIGGEGDDWVRGGTHDDYLFLGAGDDISIPDIEDQLEMARTDPDNAETYLAEALAIRENTEGGNDTVHGGDGADSIVDGFGSDEINGNAQADTLNTVDVGGLGFADTVHGGYGYDTLMGDDGDHLFGDQGVDSFVVFPTAGADPVIISDYETGEDIFIADLEDTDVVTDRTIDGDVEILVNDIVVARVLNATTIPSVT